MNRSKTVSVGCEQFQPNHEVPTAQVATYNTKIVTYNCSALNRRRNLIFIYWINVNAKVGCLGGRISACNLFDRLFSIFTSEGDCVTTRVLTRDEFTFETKTACFTDHMIMIYRGMDKPAIFTDFLLDFTRFPQKISFVDFDKNGDIYTNGSTYKAIAVYAQNLEFKRMLEVNLPNFSILISLAIRDRLMVVQAYSTLSKAFEFHKFVISPFDSIKHIELFALSQIKFTDICIDRFNNIFASNICAISIWPYKCKGRYHVKFEEKENYTHFLLTEDSQIIRICRSGILQIHQLIHEFN